MVNGYTQWYFNPLILSYMRYNALDSLNIIINPSLNVGWTDLLSAQNKYKSLLEATAVQETGIQKSFELYTR